MIVQSLQTGKHVLGFERKGKSGESPEVAYGPPYAIWASICNFRRHGRPYATSGDSALFILRYVPLLHLIFSTSGAVPRYLYCEGDGRVTGVIVLLTVVVGSNE